MPRTPGLPTSTYKSKKPSRHPHETPLRWIMETNRIRHEFNRLDDFSWDRPRGNLVHHHTTPMGDRLNRCIYLSCGEEFVWEDRISLRSHDGGSEEHTSEI